MIKRIFDIAVSIIGLVITAPILAIAAIAIRLDGQGPILFRQDRVGYKGKLFTIHKLRTMRSACSTGPQVSTDDDARITRVGSWLRVMKVDELPQLFDVLRGAMSLVGPRPEVPRYVQFWPVKYREPILSVKPGITDPASIYFRHEARILSEVEDPENYYIHTLLPIKCKMYRDYANTQSFVGDLRILCGTLLALGRPNAGGKLST